MVSQLLRQLTALDDDLLAVVGEGQVLADVTLLAIALDVHQSANRDVEGAMHVLRLDRTHCKTFIEALQELRQESVAFIRVADTSEPQFLDQPVLQCSVHSFHASSPGRLLQSGFYEQVI